MSACPSADSFLTVTQHAHPLSPFGFTAEAGWFIWTVNKSIFGLHWWIISFGCLNFRASNIIQNNPIICMSQTFQDLGLCFLELQKVCLKNRFWKLALCEVTEGSDIYILYLTNKHTSLNIYMHV